MRHDPIDPAGCPGAERPPGSISDEVVQELSRLLDRLERQSRASIASVEAELEVLEAREAGDLEDNSARATAMTLASELLVRDRKELEEISAARSRLAARTFGTCETCHVSIPLFRLQALPATRLCVTCQDRTETREPAAR